MSPSRSPIATSWNCPRWAAFFFATPRPGEIVEVNTARAAHRRAFAKHQTDARGELARLFRSAAIDSIQIRTDEPYGAALGRFFETRERRRLHG